MFQLLSRATAVIVGLFWVAKQYGVEWAIILFAFTIIIGLLFV